MTLKRVGSLKNKKHKHCLQCGRVLVGLKDNTEHECSFCGQKHFVDIYGTTLVLTAAERPDLRHRTEPKNPDDPEVYRRRKTRTNLKRTWLYSVANGEGKDQVLGLKIFLGVMIALMLLGIIGANTKCSKTIAGAIAICCIVLLAAIIAKENQPKVTAVAPKSGKIQTEQNAWGTITVTDDTGVTREYQGCIHISGTYPYETTEYMGLCVSMESAIETGEWSPGMYKLYYESEGKYWEAKNNEKESKTDE
ncbi:hypothetical protein DW070_16290 [Coprococcus catus]|uniref:Uncharacterized protein n=1 Tax=Coprococcus catus TaxID=116085 RepID=A0A3E2TD97_9FIRM|nr:hypothetical protein DW070_16290 [Coprococcus catus]